MAEHAGCLQNDFAGSGSVGSVSYTRGLWFDDVNSFWKHW
jgi:hypothetical protein